MQLFWKRNKAQSDTTAELSDASDSGSRGPALGGESSFEPASVDSLLHDYRESGPAKTPHDLVFADEAEVLATAEQQEAIDVESLVDRLTDRRCRPYRGPVYWMWMAASPVFLLFLIGCLMNGDLHWAPLWLFALATVRMVAVQSARQEQDRAALLNAHLDNRWLGPLCEALEWPDRKVRAIAGRLLTQFLPRLREGDAAHFREEHRTCLYRRLTLRESLSNPELALAVLQALPIIGTEASLPYVERLTALPALTRNSRRVRSMARAVLAGLERHVSADRAAALAARPRASLPGRAGHAQPEVSEDQLSDAEREELAAMNALVDRQMAEFEAAIRKLRVPGMRMGFLLASWGIIFPYFAVQTVLQFAGGHWPRAMLAALLALFTTQLYRLTLTAEHQRLARKLWKVEDVRCIGRLAELLEWPDAGVRNLAIDKLTRLLRKVKASDKVLTTARQRGNLHRMLVLPNARHHAEFLKSILLALGQIGDSTSVPFVQNLASAAPTSARQREVCDAARDCLEFLKVRAELNRSSQTLLRASCAGAAPSDMLVRPADARAVTDPAQLLRADSGNPTS